MKKHLLMGAILMGGLAMAQTVKGVGVETDKPTETFQVQGTARITDLPEDGTKQAIHTKKLDDGSFEASDAKDQPFKAKKTVLVDEN